MKHILLIIASLCLLTSCQESLEERALRECQEYTAKNCPHPEGDNLWLDSLVFHKETHTFVRYFRLTGQLDRAEAFEHVDAKSLLIGELRNTTTAKVYKDAHYNFRYIYRSGSNPAKLIFKTTLTAKDYR